MDGGRAALYPLRPMIDFELTEEQRALIDVARRFAREKIIPVAAEADRKSEFPKEVFHEAWKLGLANPTLPAEYGGPGLSDLDSVLVTEELAYGCSGIQTSITANTLGLTPIKLAGSEEQKKTWLPPMATGEVLAAIAMTEPGAGSDLKAIRATAVRDGDEYVLNGSKTFITNGSSADLVLLAAKTDPKAGARGISLILVDVRDAPGYQVTRVLDKVGMHGADTAEISFTNVRVPVTNLLGADEGAGFGQMIAQLPQERLIVSAQAQGGMERAVDDTVAYTKDREAFGHSLFKFQNTAFELAECMTIARTSRVFLDHCIESHLQGRLDGTEAAMAKYWLTDKQCEVVDRCVQLHGGYGYMREYLIARMYEDARVQRIYAGANEVMKEIIARSL